MWPIEPPTTMSMPFIEMPQRDDGIALDDEQPAMAGGARRLAGIARDPDQPDIMFSATPTPALPWIDDLGLLVHAGAIVADMPVDLDRDRRIEADGDRVLPVRIEDVASASRWSRAAACAARR